MAVKCWDCQKEIPIYENMGGRGYQSQTIRQMIEGDIGGRPVGVPVTAELCLECYRIDHKKKYPDLEVPV